MANMWENPALAKGNFTNQRIRENENNLNHPNREMSPKVKKFCVEYKAYVDGLPQETISQVRKEFPDAIAWRIELIRRSGIHQPREIREHIEDHEKQIAHEEEALELFKSYLFEQEEINGISDLRVGRLRDKFRRLYHNIYCDMPTRELLNKVTNFIERERSRRKQAK